MALPCVENGNRALEQPAPHGPHLVENVRVHDNTITMSGNETTGAAEDNGDQAIFTTNRNRFYANTYYVDSLTGEYFSWASGNVDWSRGVGTGMTLVAGGPCW